MNTRRFPLATYVVLGSSALYPLAYVVYSHFRYGLSSLFPGCQQAITTIAFIAFVVAPYAFAASATVLLPKLRRPSLTMLVGSVLVSAVHGLSVLYVVWYHFFVTLDHDMQTFAMTVAGGACLQWPIALSTVGLACLLSGDTYIKHAMRMFVGLAGVLAIYLFYAMFDFDDSLAAIMACSWCLGCLVVIMLLLAIVRAECRSREAAP